MVERVADRVADRVVDEVADRLELLLLVFGLLLIKYLLSSLDKVDKIG